jgi:hypothetical protein
MEPLPFNIFISDIFYFIEHGTLYNYADDNTLSYADQDYNTLINVLERQGLHYGSLGNTFLSNLPTTDHPLKFDLLLTACQ